MEELEGEHLRKALMDKLGEEHAELLAETTPEEVVNMIEVLLVLAKDPGSSEAETMQLLRKRRKERSGFAKGYSLSHGPMLFAWYLARTQARYAKEARNRPSHAGTATAKALEVPEAQHGKI